MRLLAGYLENINGAEAALDVMDRFNLDGYRGAVYYLAEVGSLHGWRPETFQYILDHSNKIVIIDRYHRYPFGTLNNAQFNEAIELLLQAAAAFPDSKRVKLEFTNEVTNDNLFDWTFEANKRLRAAGFSHDLIQNKWDNHNFADIKRLLPDSNFITGRHMYFNVNPVPSMISQMRDAVNLGLRVINTEVGASYNEYNDYNSSNVGRLNDYLQQSEALEVDNAVWMNKRVENWQRYVDLRMYWTTNILPTPEPTPTPTPAPVPNPTIAARAHMFGNSALVHIHLRKLRNKLITEEVHRKLHPLV